MAYLRTLHGKGCCCWRHGRTAVARRVFAQMLRLNLNDNQGARFLLDGLERGRTWAEEVTWEEQEWASQPDLLCPGAACCFKALRGSPDVREQVRIPLRALHYVQSSIERCWAFFFASLCSDIPIPPSLLKNALASRMQVTAVTRGAAVRPQRHHAARAWPA